MRKPNQGRALALVGALFLSIVPAALPAAAVGPTVFINEIHYDNLGTDAGEAIEIAGPAGTDLAGWSLVLYNGSGGASYDTDPLTGLIPDLGGNFGVVVLNYAVNGVQNGSPDGIALVNGSTVVQFLSYEGTFVAVGGPANGITSFDIGVSETGSEAVGLSLQLTGTGTGAGDFAWSPPATSSFGAVNSGQSFGTPANLPITLTCAAISGVSGLGASGPVSANDPDGTVTSLTITSIAPSDPGTITLDGVVPATGVGGVATGTLTVAAITPAGTYSVGVTATNDDAAPQSGSCTLIVTLVPIRTIGEVQGSVPDSANGPTHRSGFAPPSGNGTGQTVVVQGIITELTLARTSSGGFQKGFFLQNTLAASDTDPNSSDGIFVFMGGFNDLIGGYVPVVGDEVIISGRVVEFFNLTELSSARALAILRSGVDLAAEVSYIDAAPPSVLGDAGRYWERIEGMQVSIPTGSVVLNGRNVFPSTLDGEVWLARPDSTVGARSSLFTDRSFRDPHPLDDLPGLFDNGNGYRIVLGSLGIKAALNDRTALINPARTFDRLNATASGGVYFSFNKYQVQVTQLLSLIPGPDPSTNAAPRAADRTVEYSVDTYNLENLYDFRDDPTDGCDFAGNAGCPGVSPPFDYVPLSQAAYEGRLAELAHQIIINLHAPDILLVQEIEDQDLNGDGSPDSLEDLAAVISGSGGPTYTGAYDRDGADDRGITAAFFFRSDRVELLPVGIDDRVFGATPGLSYRGAPLGYNTHVSNPKALNADLPDDVDLSTGVDGTDVFTRAPEVAKFRVWRSQIGASVWIDMYVVSNHFSSTPNARVGQRIEQALYNTAIVDALQAADPHARVVVGGDLNVFPRPDDPVIPASDQLRALYEQGLTNLWDVLVEEEPASAYSYVFEGQAQTLDHLFVTTSVLPELVQIRAAHINADWPADFPGDGARGVSDHDPQTSLHGLEPTVDRLKLLGSLFIEDGQIDVKQGANLLAALDRVQQAIDKGNLANARSLMEAFIGHVNDYMPNHVGPVAGMALIGEAELWLDLN